MLAFLLAGAIAQQTAAPAAIPGGAKRVLQSWRWKLDREWVLGDGPVVRAGDRVTVNFVVTSPSGREVANTMKRGLAFTQVADPSGDAISQALIGMRETGEREISATLDPPGMQPIVTADEPLRIRIKILKLVSSPGPGAAQKGPLKTGQPSPKSGG